MVEVVVAAESAKHVSLGVQCNGDSGPELPTICGLGVSVNRVGICVVMLQDASSR